MEIRNNKMIRVLGGMCIPFVILGSLMMMNGCLKRIPVYKEDNQVVIPLGDLPIGQYSKITVNTTELVAEEDVNPATDKPVKILKQDDGDLTHKIDMELTDFEIKGGELLKLIDLPHGTFINLKAWKTDQQVFVKDKKDLIAIIEADKTATTKDDIVKLIDESNTNPYPNFSKYFVLKENNSATVLQASVSTFYAKLGDESNMFSGVGFTVFPLSQIVTKNPYGNFFIENLGLDLGVATPLTQSNIEDTIYQLGISLNWHNKRFGVCLGNLILKEKGKDSFKNAPYLGFKINALDLWGKK